MHLSSLELCKFIFYLQLHNHFGVNMDINSSLQLSLNICLHSRYFTFRIQEGKCSQDWLLSYIPSYFNVLCQDESITSNESGKKRGRAITNSFIVILTILPSDHRITFMLRYLRRLHGHILPERARPLTGICTLQFHVHKNKTHLPLTPTLLLSSGGGDT